MTRYTIFGSEKEPSLGDPTGGIVANISSAAARPSASYAIIPTSASTSPPVVAQTVDCRVSQGLAEIAPVLSRSLWHTCDFVSLSFRCGRATLLPLR